jgi:hypothetical protein
MPKVPAQRIFGLLASVGAAIALAAGIAWHDKHQRTNVASFYNEGEEAQCSVAFADGSRWDFHAWSGARGSRLIHLQDWGPAAVSCTTISGEVLQARLVPHAEGLDLLLTDEGIFYPPKPFTIVH